jgi:hypothetical protein
MPFARIMQRHWKARRADPIADGYLKFSLDTLPDVAQKTDEGVKTNSSWATILPKLIESKGPNTEVHVGLAYDYARCINTIGSADFPEHLLSAIEVIQPFFQMLTVDL